MRQGAARPHLQTPAECVFRSAFPLGPAAPAEFACRCVAAAGSASWGVAEPRGLPAQCLGHGSPPHRVQTPNPLLPTGGGPGGLSLPCHASSPSAYGGQSELGSKGRSQESMQMRKLRPSYHDETCGYKSDEAGPCG
ncbi:hypothetical protein NDU88_004427 [Pleurodeles waltl]|uniref:Uncharacterized protein n=1 Tax=Pleurodeles waltl TaxID=8319 RepID=A0AAV7T7L7_PLEWA|nr:hypothetical protein NDU88_004427 [Pleurodeles waltl]